MTSYYTDITAIYPQVDENSILFAPVRSWFHFFRYMPRFLSGFRSQCVKASKSLLIMIFGCFTKYLIFAIEPQRSIDLQLLSYLYLFYCTHELRDCNRGIFVTRLLLVVTHIDFMPLSFSCLNTIDSKTIKFNCSK